MHVTLLQRIEIIDIVWDATRKYLAQRRVYILATFVLVDYRIVGLGHNLHTGGAKGLLPSTCVFILHCKYHSQHYIYVCSMYIRIFFPWVLYTVIYLTVIYM